MKKVMTLVAGLVLGVCLTAQAGYQSEVIVTPGSEAHQYLVQFKIMEVAKDGKVNVLMAPKIAVMTGKEGQIAISDYKMNSGISCTAFVKETQGGVEAATTIIMKDNGVEKLNTAQSVTLKK